MSAEPHDGRGLLCSGRDGVRVHVRAAAVHRQVAQGDPRPHIVEASADKEGRDPARVVD